MEPRGGIEPPHVHGVVHGRRFRFCCCTRHIKHHHKMMLCPAYTGHLWSHREESNLQPTDYKTVALPVELRWHICAVSLRLTHPGLGGDIMISHSQGSFQRDSAFLTLKGCHYTRSRPAMATGRPLVISLARYATPIRQYSVFPQSFAARGVRPLMPRIVGWCSTGGILHTEGVAADAPTPPHPCEGGRGMGAQGHTLPHSHFRIYHALRFPHEGITATFSVK